MLRHSEYPLFGSLWLVGLGLWLVLGLGLVDPRIADRNQPRKGPDTAQPFSRKTRARHFPSQSSASTWSARESLRTTGTWFLQAKFPFRLKNYHHNHFMALFPGRPGWSGARKELLDFMVQGEINRGRHTDHPAGRHSVRTNQCPPPPSPHIFYGPDSLPAAQPTVSKHWRQLAHSD